MIFSHIAHGPLSGSSSGAGEVAGTAGRGAIAWVLVAIPPPVVPMALGWPAGWKFASLPVRGCGVCGCGAWRRGASWREKWECRKKWKGGGCVWVYDLSSRRAAEGTEGEHAGPGAPDRQEHRMWAGGQGVQACRMCKKGRRATSEEALSKTVRTSPAMLIN